MAEVIPQITVDSSKVKNTWVQNEVVTNDVYNAINKAVINLKDNNNLLDSNAMLFREEYNSSSKNLNNAIHQGIYSFTSSAVNVPSGVTGGNLLVTNTTKTEQGSSIITQIAFCHNGAVYARTKNTSENFTAWNKLAYITDTISRAIADKNGLEIDTGYLKLTGGTMTGNINSNTTNEIRIVTPASIGLFVNPSQITTGLYDWSSDTGKEVWVYKKDKNLILSGVQNIQIPTPSTSDNSNQVATTAFVNNYAPSKIGVGATGTWKININGNASTSTNADNATKATKDGQGNIISSTYLKLSGGQMTGNITTNVTSGSSWGIQDTNSKMAISFNNNNGQPKFVLYDPNNSSSTSVLEYNSTTQILSLVANSTVPTPSTSDNSTKIATTAFVKSLFTASKQQNGWWKDGNTGIIWQWGSYYTTGTKQYFTFPITFPNGLFVITEAHIVSVDNDFKTCSIINPDKNGFTINATENGYVANVIAIGY